jgi:hypothetical protein
MASDKCGSDTYQSGREVGECVECGETWPLNDLGECPFDAASHPEVVRELEDKLDELVEEHDLYTVFWSLDTVYDRYDSKMQEVDPMTEHSSDGISQTRVGHCKADSTDVYVGRGPGGRSMLDTPIGERGWLGNPYPADEYGRGESIENFREAFEEKLKLNDAFREAVGDLAGRDLGCWCQRLDEDGPACHAEIIAEHADRISRQVRAETEHSEGSQ